MNDVCASDRSFEGCDLCYLFGPVFVPEADSRCRDVQHLLTLLTTLQADIYTSICNGSVFCVLHCD